jgi:hypothetical protein
MKNIYTEDKIVQHLGLQPCDRIITPKSDLKWIKHHSIYLGFDQLGNHYICENIIGKGVTLSRVLDFCQCNSEIIRIEKFTGSNIKRRESVQKALSKLGQPYSLIVYNCEHFANDVLNNNPVSNQIKSTITILAVAALLGIILS